MLIFYSRYQNELPKKIKSRGKDAHLIHDEMVQTIKWKLAVSPEQHKAPLKKHNFSTIPNNDFSEENSVPT